MKNLSYTLVDNSHKLDYFKKNIPNNKKYTNHYQN